jgi:hypothetical protein
LFKLYEGMRAGDLNDLVLPLISVDEYESKIDPAAVAIGFYVHDEEAAGDLNRFLQKSPVDLLSSEVSPAPDQHGYFIIFIEMMANTDIGRNLADLLSEIEPLCGITKWKLRVRKTAGLVTFTPANFITALKAARRSDESVILDFLVPSVLEQAAVQNGRLILEGAGRMHACQVSGQVTDFGIYARVLRRQHLAGRAIAVDLAQIVRCNRMTALLGEGWSAVAIDRNLLIQHVSSDNCLLFRPDEW